MLTITIPAVETFDEANNEFISTDAVVLELEHSLASLSKWEATWEKPFLGSEKKSTEETIGYIKAMTLTPNVPPEIFQRLTLDNFNQINAYVDAKSSATWFTEKPSPVRREIITAEIIYYWMIALNIPLDFEKRHLNQLFTQIKVCNQKNSPDKQKKMSPREMAAQRQALNQKRQQEMKTAG